MCFFFGRGASRFSAVCIINVNSNGNISINSGMFYNLIVLFIVETEIKRGFACATESRPPYDLRNWLSSVAQ